ncbi:MAG: phytoene desaturase family protein [Solirubrobacteraceae bacterium]
MSHDAVVIGSGPNGLVAANMLADHGWSVVVVEEHDEPGGAVRSAELVEPGFANDVFSAFYPLAAVSPFLRGLELERHGLVWRSSGIPVAHPRRDGTCAFISRDLEESVANVESFAPGDGDAYRELYELWERVGRDLIGLLFDPFPPVKPVARLVRKLGYEDGMRFLRFMLMSTRRHGEETFAGDGGRRLLAANALHADLSPEAPPSAVYGLVLVGLAQQVGFPVPEGGAGGLSRALVRRLEAKGGSMRCGARATRVEVSGGRARAVIAGDERFEARRAILADVGAPQLYLDLLDEVPQRLRRDLRRFQYDNSTVKVDWALDGEIPWTAEPARRAGTIHVAEGVDHLTKHAASLACGEMPETPWLVMGQYAHFDPTRAPAGKETAWGYTHVPQGGWKDSYTDGFVEQMEAEVEALAPGFRDLIRGRHVHVPGTMEATNRNLVGGAINGGTAQLHQQLVFRPTPNLARAETPVEGLYLASASAHPGGGVHGAPGAHAVHAALQAQRRLRSPIGRLSRALQC